jgi:hypothetical protein
MDCGKITTGFTGGSCSDKLPIGGTGTRLIFINHSDIDFENSSAPSAGILDEIVLKTGKVGYLFETLGNANEGGFTFNKGTYVTTYAHSVTARMFKDGAAAKAWLDEIKDARLVIIVEKREDNASKFEVYGWNSGLKMSENTGSTTLTDNVAFAPVFSSEDGAQEPALPYTFFDTDEETTEAAITALVTPASNL